MIERKKQSVNLFEWYPIEEIAKNIIVIFRSKGIPVNITEMGLKWPSHFNHLAIHGPVKAYHCALKEPFAIRLHAGSWMTHLMVTLKETTAVPRMAPLSQAVMEPFVFHEWTS